MKLYRIDCGTLDEAVIVLRINEWSAGVLVAVEPCEHGKIDEHLKPTMEWVGVKATDEDWCSGAAVKGDNDA